MRKIILAVLLLCWSVGASAQIVNPGIDTGSWTAYTPTVTPGSGAFTTVSATGRYKQVGKTVFLTLTVNITTNGTAATNVSASLPVASATVGSPSYNLTGRAANVSGKALQASILSGNNTNAVIVNYDNTYPGATGEALVVSGVYEAQ